MNSIALCHLRRHVYYEPRYPRYSPPPLPLAPERGKPSHDPFLKTNRYQNVLILPNSFIRNSKFDIRYSFNPAKPWIFMRISMRLFDFQSHPTTGKTVAIVGLPLCGSVNRPALHFLSLSATYGGMFITNLAILATLYPWPLNRGSPSHHPFLKTNRYQNVLILPNSSIRNSTFDIRYSFNPAKPWIFMRISMCLLLAFQSQPITTNHGQNRGYYWATAPRFCEYTCLSIPLLCLSILPVLPFSSSLHHSITSSLHYSPKTPSPSLTVRK